MKITHAALTLLIFILWGCSSDTLNNSKAEKIIRKCVENDPDKYQKTTILESGEVRLSKDKEISKYEKLRDQGLITMTVIEQDLSKASALTEYANKRSQAFNIQLTKKADQFIDIGRNGKQKIRTFAYEVDEVLEVQEIPSNNIANVQVKYKVVNKTPFFILSPKYPDDFTINKVTMKKTSNGWKYCDTY